LSNVHHEASLRFDHDQPSPWPGMEARVPVACDNMARLPHGP
jgi:hypothetical protein